CTDRTTPRQRRAQGGPAFAQGAPPAPARPSPVTCPGVAWRH
ncbi:MAG: hypothetical protein AVDCRST_MAG07-2652, partial [uncultured Frankineae bacterium]